MTAREKYEAIKKVESHFHAEMDGLRQEYRTQVRDILRRAEARRIAEIKAKLHQL